MARYWWVFLVLGLVLVLLLPTPRKPPAPAATAPTTAPDLASEPLAAPEASRAAAFERARRGFRTAAAVPEDSPSPPATPPVHLFQRSDYENPQGYTLTGYVSADPADGRRHPAILWLKDGDSNSLGEFWESGQTSASAFREAGVVMAFIALRGGNGQRGRHEYFLGEVDDVLAAARHYAGIRYIDPARIYLGGHGSGGTLALLVAAAGGPFAGVFAFGPVASADRYPRDRVPVDFASLDPLELRLRSPIHWLADIGVPTWIIEGVDAPSKISDLIELCEATSNPRIVCLRVPGANHASVIRPATRAIAARIMQGGAIELRAAELSP
ncbi:MAG: prolyl oligopeptidase family serine peptidase [Xanthomonadales bacterium]|nr:hypothetical protein [Xanthomonadales bacterium]MCC6594360.1 prolyl oligopeptidase family serine peptidase [Xanthomonadales bacterium]MCE7931215.1 peptidase [Xanthomonadales bacterium PRO6]